MNNMFDKFSKTIDLFERKDVKKTGFLQKSEYEILLSQTYKQMEVNKDRIPVKLLQTEYYNDMAGNLSSAFAQIFKLKLVLNSDLHTLMALM